jgi:histidinol dehydrogenase
MKIMSAESLPDDFFAGWFDEGWEDILCIVGEVRREGDKAVRRFTELFDRVKAERWQATEEEIRQAADRIPSSLAEALELAARDIRLFAERQKAQLQDFEVEVAPGVFCGQRVIAVERAGLYVPAGRFPLVSSLLMAAVPAGVAGVREIAVCSPPLAGGGVHPIILAAAGLLGIREVYAVGGAQAIAALAFGTETIKKVDMIVGPGSRRVVQAKKAVFGAVGIDLLAGPSEVVIVADDSADPEFVAADLVAQAEHDPDASALLMTNSARLAGAVRSAVERGLARLPFPADARESLGHRGLIVLVKDMEEAAAISNRKAPEHLEIQVRDAASIAPLFRHYGGLFIGPWTSEVWGDYTAGPNHILPTGSSARFASGLSVRHFLKLQSSLRLEPRGVRAIGPAARVLAESEGMAGHSAAAQARLARLPADEGI